MKFKYYFLSVALAATAMVGFTSCSDDDEPTVNESKDLAVSKDVTRVKIGEGNRVELPVLAGAGDYRAFSLNPEVCDVVKGEDGKTYIEGYKNGKATVVVSDATGTYKSFDVSVYTTENMTLSHEEFNFEAPLGVAATTKECGVVLGNGEYTATSDNGKVAVRIDAETGEMTITATSAKDPYTATITVKDASDLQAQVLVNVTATFDGFTASELADIAAKTQDEVYGSCKDPSDGTTPYYFYGNYAANAAYWYNTDADGVHTLGWWMLYSGRYDYGGIKMEYPTGTPVNTEVAGKLYYAYSYYMWYDTYVYDGTVKVLVDDDVRTIAVFWNVDLENECINRGYVVRNK